MHPLIRAIHSFLLSPHAGSVANELEYRRHIWDLWHQWWYDELDRHMRYKVTHRVNQLVQIIHEMQQEIHDLEYKSQQLDIVEATMESMKHQ